MVIGSLGDLVVGGAICFLAQVIKLPLLPSSFSLPRTSSETTDLIYVC